MTQKIDATPRYYTVQRVYDGMGRQTKLVSGGITVDTVYQSPTVTKQSVPYQGTSLNLFTVTTVNPTAHTTTVQAPDSNSMVTTTNALVTTVTDANGNLTTSTSDIWGRLVSAVPPTGPSTAYTYDELDRLKTATYGSAVTAINYDNAGRKIGMDDPDMGTSGTTTDSNWAWTYQYDGAGNLTSQTDARSCTLTLGYDLLNRLTSKTSLATNCGTAANNTYTYDVGTNGIGRRTGMTSPSVSNSWTYDTRGRVINETVNPGTSYTTQWTYNSADLPVTMTYPDGEVVTNAYDTRMLLNSVIGTNTYVSSTSYDSAGRVTSRALGNTKTQTFTYYGWAETALVNNVAIGQGGRLKNITVGTLQNATYAYDKVGNIQSIQNSLASETQTFGYDTLNRITSASATGTYGYNEAYAYNSGNGNLITKGSLTQQYTDNAHKHAVTNSGSNTYLYGSSGNLRKRTIGSQITAFGYDAENRMVKVCTDSNNNATCDTGEPVIATFTYDGDGNRVQSTANGTTTTFAGGHYEVTGSAVTKYYFAGVQRIAMRKYTIPQPMTVEYLLGDHLGSTSISTDNTGAKVSEIRYKAWGEIRYSWTSGVATTPAYKLANYTFTGQYSYMDDPTTIGTTEGFGLMFYNARWYDPVTGRFTQADTIVPNPYNPQSLDRYAYALNNPIRYSDPSGHVSCTGSNWDDGPQCTSKTSFWHTALQDTFNWKAARDFTLKELKTIYQVGIDIAAHVGGADVMRQMLGSVDFDKKAMNEGGLGAAHHVTLNENFSKWALGDQRWTIAHEIGHAWDGANGGALSKGMQNYLHSIYPTRISKDEYDYGSPGNGPGATGWPDSSWGDHSPTGWNAQEDFAQSFAAYINPDIATSKLWNNYHQTYGSGYNSYYDTPRGQYIADQIRGYWPFY